MLPVFKSLLSLVITAATSLHSIASTALTIHCDFQLSSTYYTPPEVYECRVDRSLVVTSPNEQITAVTGLHYVNMTNADVTGIRIKHKTLNFMPKGLVNFFPNLELIYISRSHLKELHASDLKPFPRLRNLDLGFNDLTVIERDLFEFSERLEVLLIRDNPLKHVETSAFEGLRRLRFLTMGGCITERVRDNRIAVLTLIERMKSSCYDRETAVKSYERLSNELEKLREEMKEILTSVSLKDAEAKQKLAEELKNVQLESENEKIKSLRNSRMLQTRVKVMAGFIAALVIVLLLSSLTFLYIRLVVNDKEEGKRPSCDYGSIETINSIESLDRDTISVV